MGGNKYGLSWALRYLFELNWTQICFCFYACFTCQPHCPHSYGLSWALRYITILNQVEFSSLGACISCVPLFWLGAFEETRQSLHWFGFYSRCLKLRSFGGVSGECSRWDFFFFQDLFVGLCFLDSMKNSIPTILELMTLAPAPHSDQTLTVCWQVQSRDVRLRSFGLSAG